jgi:hypothetical protein
VFTAYLYAALRRIYLQPRSATLVKAALLSVTSIVLVVEVWRNLLFHVALALVS